MGMDNLSRPIPPNKSEGCYVCGAGLDQILSSRTVSGMSVALCTQHQNATSVSSRPAGSFLKETA